MALQDDLKIRIHALTASIDRAGERVENGELVELTTLEASAAQLCDSVQGLGAEEAHALRDDMATMITALDRLAVKLEEFMNAKRAQLGDGGMS